MTPAARERRRAPEPPAIPLWVLAAGIRPAPADLDRYLDAALRCFTRHGIRRTSVQDVAREAGVNRATVYRQVGNVESMVRLLMARELHRLLQALPGEVDVRSGPEAVVALVAQVVGHARTHPVTVKVLHDEPELIGPFLATEMAEHVTRLAALVAPLLEWSMAGGMIARRDPQLLAEWLVRVSLTLILAPPPGDLEQFLGELLLPALRA